MKLFDEYSQYCQYIKDFPSCCTFEDVRSRVAHRSEAALSLLWKNGLFENIEANSILFFLSVNNRFDIYLIKYELSDGSDDRMLKVSVCDVPQKLMNLYNLLNSLYNEPRAAKWWKLCFSWFKSSSSYICYDEQYDDFFVTDSSEMCFRELLDLCRKSIASLSITFSGQEVLIMADDNRLLPLVFTLQKYAHTSYCIAQKPFDECSDELISDFRKRMCLPPASHRVCLMSTVSLSEVRFNNLIPETPQMIYVPFDKNTSNLVLAPNILLEQLIEDTTPNMEISGVRFLCFSLVSTTDVFGHTLMKIQLSDTKGKNVVLLPDGDIFTKLSTSNNDDNDGTYQEFVLKSESSVQKFEDSNVKM